MLSVQWCVILWKWGNKSEREMVTPLCMVLQFKWQKTNRKTWCVSRVFRCLKCFFRHLSIFPFLFFRNLNGIYPSGLLTVAASATPAAMFKGEAGYIQSIPLIGSAQNRVRGKLMTAATDASSSMPSLKLSKGLACGNNSVLLWDSGGWDQVSC